MKALESLKFKSSIDTNAVGGAAERVAEAVEFYLDSSPSRVYPLVETTADQDPESPDFQKRKHRILYKVRFKRNSGWKPGLRKTALVLPTAKDAAASILASISGLDPRICEMLVDGSAGASVLPLKEKAETALKIRGLVKSFGDSAHGRETVSDLMKWANDKAHAEIGQALQNLLSSAVANGFTEEHIVTVVRNAVVRSVMKK